MPAWLALMAYLLAAGFLSAVVVMLLDRTERSRRRKASRSRAWAEVLADSRQHRGQYILGLVSAAAGLYLVLEVGDDWGNVGGELFGIALTVVVIAFLGRRSEREQHKKQLIFDMGSTVQDVAIKAVEELRRRGYRNVSMTLRHRGFAFREAPRVSSSGAGAVRSVARAASGRVHHQPRAMTRSSILGHPRVPFSVAG